MLIFVFLLRLVLCQQVFDSSSKDLSQNQLQDFTVGKASLLEFHKSIVETESISQNELEVSRKVAAFLEKQGLDVELQKVTDQRYNVYAYDQERENKILLTSHIDTVPPYLPYEVKGSKIFGRGSCDAKGSVASQVFSYLALREAGEIKPGDVALLFVVGEEVDGAGMKAASELLNTTWEIGIFGEPTELKLGVGHKGMMFVSVDVEGKTAHSGYPELGISATEIMVSTLHDLLHTKLPVHELLGPTTMNIGFLQAGVAGNVVPPHAHADLTFRVTNTLAELQDIVSSQLDGIEHLKYEILFATEPQYLEFNVPGFDSIVLAYTTDVPNLHQNLTKRFLYGPGSIHVAHSDHEYIESGDLVEAIDGYKRLIKYSLNT